MFQLQILFTLFSKFKKDFQFKALAYIRAQLDPQPKNDSESGPISSPQ